MKTKTTRSRGEARVSLYLSASLSCVITQTLSSLGGKCTTNGISRLTFYQLRFTHWFQQKSSVELLLVQISDHSSANECHYRDNTGSALVYLFTLILLFFIFDCAGSLLLHVGFLQLLAGATLCCGTQASHGPGFSCCRAWVLGPMGSVVTASGTSSTGSLVVAHWFSFLWHVDSSQTRAQIHVSFTDRQILNH